MAPVPAHDGWHDEQIDELFASLFGEGFRGADVLDGGAGAAEIDAEAQRQLDESVQEGFRVFG